jgi:hypothetical protein
MHWTRLKLNLLKSTTTKVCWWAYFFAGLGFLSAAEPSHRVWPDLAPGESVNSTGLQLSSPPHYSDDKGHATDLYDSSGRRAQWDWGGDITGWWF